MRGSAEQDPTAMWDIVSVSHSPIPHPSSAVNNHNGNDFKLTSRAGGLNNNNHNNNDVYSLAIPAPLSFRFEGASKEYLNDLPGIPLRGPVRPPLSLMTSSGSERVSVEYMTFLHKSTGLYLSHPNSK